MRKKTLRLGDLETWRLGDLETWRLGERLRREMLRRETWRAAVPRDALCAETCGARRFRDLEKRGLELRVSVQSTSPNLL
jgi:hypothetical protein